MAKDLKILGIETSCDETAVAVLCGKGGSQIPQFEILSNKLVSQIDIHAEWGGVVPNIAKREHQKNLPHVLEKALAGANIDAPSDELHVIAVTAGPGLEPALWTGINFAVELARRWKLPLVAANHMEGHIVATLLRRRLKIENPRPRQAKRGGQKSKVIFPALALLVSGGHTELVFIKKWLDYKKIGETLDDAAGEAFDKVARMMGLGYPGGPVISKLAKTGNRYAFSFPRPMLRSPNYDFSFSGLKTAVLYTLRDLEKEKRPYSKNDIAASFQDAVVDTLVTKTVRAAKELDVKSLILGGGVAANDELRRRLRVAMRAAKPKIDLHLPQKEFTTDNAAMIAAAGYLHALSKDFIRPAKGSARWKKLKAHATLPLSRTK